MGNQVGYSKTLLRVFTLVSSTAMVTVIAGTINASAASYMQVAQYVYQYGPDNKIYRIDENARRNNEMFGVEEQRIRSIRRQIRRENRAKKRARARAARQRLYDVRRQERRRVFVPRYDYYGNPIIPRSAQPYRSYNQPRKTRKRVKLVYVPIPREKPYHLIAQATPKKAPLNNAPGKYAPAEKIIKTATAPKSLSGQSETKTTKVATLPKIEIETLPNPSSSTPVKIQKPTTPAITPAITPTVQRKPAAEKPAIKKAETPKTVAPKPQKKIKYTTFAETLRKIRERNKAEQQAKAAQKVQSKTVDEPEVKTTEAKPVKIKKVASLEPAKIPIPKIPAAAKPIAPTPIIIETSKPATNQISCKKARDIIIDYGFSDVKEITCKGKDYDFNAKRDGKPFKITLSALSGELKKVLRQK